MANKILVIEVDQVSTRVVEMDYVSKKPNVYSYFTIPTPLETTRDGSIRINDEFVVEFKNACSLHNITTRQCLILLSSSRIISRNHVIPYVKTSQIQGVIDGMFTEFFPVDPTQYHSKYDIVEVRKEENEIELNILAIPNELTGGYFDFAKALDLELVDIKYVGKVSIDFNKLLNGESIYESELLHSLPDSIVNAVNVYRKTKKANLKNKSENENDNVRSDGALVIGDSESDNFVPLTAVVKLEAYSSFVTIIKNNDVVLDRSVSIGFGNILEYITQNDDFGSDLTFIDALKILKKNTLLSRTFDEYVNPVDPLEKHKNLITADTSVVVEGISRAIEYYSSKNQGEYIKTMYLTGSGASIKGLSRLMQNELGYNIEVIDSFPDLNKFDDDNKIDEAQDVLVKTNEEAENQVVTLDDLNILSENIQKVETTLDLDINDFDNSFDVNMYALLITSGLSYGGIVSDEERFGDATMAQNRKDKNTTLICLLGTILVLLLSTFLAVSSLIQYNNALNKQKKLKKEISNYESLKVEEVARQYNCETAKSAELMNILSYSHSMNENLTAFIREFQDKIPSETVVLSLVANDNGITLDLQSPDKESAAKTIMQLRTFDIIDSVSSENLTDSDTYNNRLFTEEDGDRVVSYSVSLTYKSVPYDVEGFLSEAVNNESEEG